jgi:hypothetical protein
VKWHEVEAVIGRHEFADGSQPRRVVARAAGGRRCRDYVWVAPIRGMPGGDRRRIGDNMGMRVSEFAAGSDNGAGGRESYPLGTRGNR